MYFSIQLFPNCNTAANLADSGDLKSVCLDDPAWGGRIGINSIMLLKREVPAWTQRKLYSGQKDMNLKYFNHVT
jgi:hypothetical protein